MPKEQPNRIVCCLDDGETWGGLGYLEALTPRQVNRAEFNGKLAAIGTVQDQYTVQLQTLVDVLAVNYDALPVAVKHVMSREFRDAVIRGEPR